MITNCVKISDRYIGANNPCFIIAEAGVNHNGNLSIAFQLIDSAYSAGADAVKFQSFVTEDLVVPQAEKASYQVQTTGGSNKQFEMLKSLELTFEQHFELKKHCDRMGIIYLCTPYEKKSVDMLEKMKVDAFKVASTDTTNIPFLDYLSKKNIPIILSTGMSSMGEIEDAVEVIAKQNMRDKLIIMQCTAEYPSSLEDANLRAIRTIERAFLCPTGFSDHTPGIGVSPWAVATGACIVEKHFTLDKKMKGPDHLASLEPNELSNLVKTIRDLESALGDGVKRLMPSESDNKTKMQKSVTALRDIYAGEIIDESDISCRRPGTGLKPSWFFKITGRKAAKNISSNKLLELDDIIWKQ